MGEADAVIADAAITGAAIADGEDARYMRRALFLARQGRTHPNPMVGAVIVRSGQIVGEGFHQGVGFPHAETAAFADAGDRAHGATVYVTLEPCSFTVAANGAPRTPCSHRCIAAGVTRVVSAMVDPDPRVGGEGFRQLRAAGIAVTVGVEGARARALNAAFIRHRLTGCPYVTHKVALTLDGKIATHTGDARWITGPEARAHVHRLRDRADALVVGIGTILADDPALTTRLPSGNGRDPLRVIIDSGLGMSAAAQAARPGTLALTTERGYASRNRNVLQDVGVEVVVVPANAESRVDVAAAACLLAERGLLSVLLESGGRLSAAFWEADLVDKAVFFIAPKIVGGSNAPTPVEGNGIAAMAAARGLGTFTLRRWGRDVAFEAEVER